MQPDIGRPAFSVQARSRGGTVEVTVKGDADITTVSVLARMLDLILDKHPQRVILEVSGSGFLNCAAAWVIARAAAALPAGQLAIRRPSPAARRLLELTGRAALIEDTQLAASDPGRGTGGSPRSMPPAPAARWYVPPWSRSA